MKVLHVITSLGTGGAEVMLQKVVGAMRPKGISAAVVSLTGTGRIGRELLETEISVIALQGRGGVLLPHQVIPMIRVLREFRPDVVHSWMYHANVVAQFVVRAGCRGARPPLITSIRGALEAARSSKASLRAVRRLDAWLSSGAEAVVFNSRRAAEQHAALGYSMDRATVIPNCFDTDGFRPRPEERERVRASLGCDERMVVGLVARFHSVKDHHNFLRAARLVVTRFPECRFLLVGSGCDRDNGVLRQWIRECALDDSVALLGERRDVAMIQAALDVAVSSSITESFPNAIGEAMACGVPSVVTDVGDCKYLVGDTGLAVPPADPERLADAIVQILELPGERRQELGDRARQRILREFGMAPIIDSFTRLYEKCMQARSAEVCGE